jgi:hypothetical protein
MEFLLGVRYLSRKGAYIFSFDLKDGIYALGIVPQQRDFLIVNVRGQLYRLVGLPMGCSLSPYHFCAFTDTFVRHLRQPNPGDFTKHPEGEAYTFRQRQTKQALPTTHAVARSKNLTFGYISLRRTTNGHMCTLDSGGVLALHL